MTRNEWKKKPSKLNSSCLSSVLNATTSQAEQKKLFLHLQKHKKENFKFMIKYFIFFSVLSLFCSEFSFFVLLWIKHTASHEHLLWLINIGLSWMIKNVFIQKSIIFQIFLFTYIFYSFFFCLFVKFLFNFQKSLLFQTTLC